jgi:hypothetical protein
VKHSNPCNDNRIEDKLIIFQCSYTHVEDIWHVELVQLQIVVFIRVYFGSNLLFRQIQWLLFARMFMEIENEADEGKITRYLYLKEVGGATKFSK